MIPNFKHNIFENMKVFFLSLMLLLFPSQMVWGQSLTQSQKLIPSDRNAYDHFGYYVQIYEDFAFVCAITEGTHEVEGGLQEGSVYVYKIDSSGYWNFHQKLIGSDRSGDDHLNVQGIE